MTRRGRQAGFTLIELLVTISIIGLLVGVLVPALSSARNQGRAAMCLSNLRQIGSAFTMYAQDFEDRAMPLAYWSFEDVGAGPVVYWWGTNEASGVDYTRGFVWPYLQSPPRERSVFECPMQPWGSYKPQGAAKSITSTYGYNGYYLSPPMTPGWGMEIGQRPWLNMGHVRDTAVVFSFVDSLIDLGGSQAVNTALLDPPQIFSGGAWGDNLNPTTAFRHGHGTQAMHVDGHAEKYVAEPGWIVSTRSEVGSVGRDNGPHYVPDWREWE